MSVSIREQTAAIASGDAEALAAFYEQRFDEVYREARRVSGRDEAWCLDIVHDVMLKVVRSMRRLDDEAALRAWLRRVVLSCTYDRFRQESRRTRREKRRATAASEYQHDPTVEHERHERMTWLREQLAQGTDLDARLVHLRYSMGWTLTRIGQAVGLKPGAVDGRINRYVGRMREQAEERFND